jgi:hypothetical protein
VSVELLFSCSFMAVSAHILLLATAWLDDEMGLTQGDAVSKAANGGANPPRPAKEKHA